MTSPNPFVPLLNILRDADTAKCRVTKWKLTEAHALEIVYCTEGTAVRAMALLEAMRRGETRLLGAAVEVRL